MPNKDLDKIQEQLVAYALRSGFEKLTPAAVHAVKVRVLDTLGALVGGFFGEPCRIARNLAARTCPSDGATIVGTRWKTTAEMAAFVNGTTARYVEANDVYHGHGSSGGHPSDVVAPVLAIAEYAGANGRDFVMGVALAYEVYLRLSDSFRLAGFDHTNFCCIGTAMAAGKLLGLSKRQLSHCVSMAAVPNNTLRRARAEPLSMFKATASGFAGRAGIFAAMMAKAGMEGPHLPFEGRAGWCDHIARKRFSLDTWGDITNSYRVEETLIKPRASCAATISSILAAEKIAPLKNLAEVEGVTVEIYEKAKASRGTSPYYWNPTSKESADHSIPFATAAALMDGTVSPRSFNDAHLRDPTLRALMQKIKVESNAEFTRAYEEIPARHRTRITIRTTSGEQIVGESGVNKDELSDPKSDEQIAKKFFNLTEGILDSKCANSIVDRLMHLEDTERVGDVLTAFSFC